MNAKISKRESKLLELTMRDVLGGMEDAASYIGFQSVPDTLEILSIEPAGRVTWPQRQPVQFNAEKTADIVDYLITRELRMSA